MNQFGKDKVRTGLTSQAVKSVLPILRFSEVLMFFTETRSFCVTELVVTKF